jgi:iron(III) transport system ATP-binding protein
MTRPLLRISGLHAAYGGTRVLHDVGLELDEGRIACLVGPSGCGKTTLLRCIAGFEAPTAGQVELAGRVVSDGRTSLPPDQRRVGVVFQDYALFPHLSVRGNVGFGLARRPKAEARRRVDELLAAVDLTSLAERFPHELSGGQQQRVALARALAPEPALLLLDEPFSNLDAELSRRLLLELRRVLVTLGITVVMVTHDQDEAFDVADVMGVMQHGRLLQWGEPRRLYERPESRMVAECLGPCALLPTWPAPGGGLESELGPVPTGGRDASGSPCVMLRPDDVELSDDGPANAEIVRVSFRGTHVVYTARLASGREVPCFVPLRAAAVRVVGERVRLRSRALESVLLAT